MNFKLNKTQGPMLIQTKVKKKISKLIFNF